MIIPGFFVERKNVPGFCMHVDIYQGSTLKTDIYVYTAYQLYSLVSKMYDHTSL